MTIIASLLFALFLFFSLEAQEPATTPLPLAISEAESSSIVHGCVNAITGTFFDFSNDLTVAGAAPLSLQRVYFGSTYLLASLHHGWQHSHESYILSWKDMDKKTIGRYCEPLASTTFYKESSVDQRRVSLGFHHDVNRRGLTNCGQGILSGQSNLKNIRLHSHAKGKEIEAIHGSHHKRLYRRIAGSDYCYKIIQDFLPTGNSYLYEYDQNGTLQKVKAVNSDQNHSFGELLFAIKNPREFEKCPLMSVTASDGRQVTYHFTLVLPNSHEKKYKAQPRHLLTEVHRPGMIEKYEYCKTPGGHSDVLTRKVLPEGRYLGIRYYFGEKNLVLNGRVKALTGPVGVDGSEVPLYHFTYNLNANRYGIIQGPSYTDVTDALGNRTRYHFSGHERLIAIEYYSLSGSLLKVERLFWANEGSREYGNLIAKATYDSDNNLIKAITYIYDRWGNVVEEKLWGTITGLNTQQPKLSANGVIENTGAENVSKSFTYSQDGCNHLLTKTENGKTEEFTYVPDTHLIASKFIRIQDQIAMREFYEYDENGVEIVKIVDNGCASEIDNLENVTKRFTTITKPTVISPMGLPEVVEEYGWDAILHQDHLIKKTKNYYTQEGWLLRQEAYDNTGIFCYCLKWDYNERGQAISHENALGHITHNRYDANGNLLFTQGPNDEACREHTYDSANRLVSTQETWSTGETFVTENSYDLMGNKVCIRDMYLNETLFEYDALGQIVKKILPPLVDGEGNSVPIVYHFTYDALGNLVKVIDPRGNKTNSSYTILNKPYKLHHPDGTEEKNQYDLQGNLTKAISPSGAFVQYEYDWQGRCVHEMHFGADGVLLSEISKHFDAFHLMTEIDPAGVATHYTYDFAGRIRSIVKDETKIEYVYDTWGRKAEEVHRYGSGEHDYFLHHYEYDSLNRIVLEQICDSLGETLEKYSYAYDRDGNLIEKLAYNETGPCKEISRFNPRKQLIQTTDALGNQTAYYYDYAFELRPGFKCLQRTIIDPLGQKTIDRFNSHQEVVETLIYSPQDEVIQHTRWLYDACDNKTERIEYAVKEAGTSTRNEWTYDTRNRVVSFKESAASGDHVTQWTYDPDGNKEKIIKPSGIVLHHTYDGLNRLTRLHSSDGTIDYRYTYDTLSNPVRIQAISGLETIRRYDRLGRMVSEVLENGLEIKLGYDRLGRITQVTFPNNSSQEITYRGKQIATIRKISSQREEEYVHSYSRYNLMGKPLEIRLGNGLGSIYVDYDPLGRPIALTAPFRNETLEFDPVGNIVRKTLQDTQGSKLYTFAYDGLYQLIEEDGISAHSYAYDSLHNRINKDGNEVVYNELNQLVHTNNQTFLYDKEGNLASIEEQSQQIKTFSYDALDRLIAVTTNDAICRYTYDADHRRITKEMIQKDTQEIETQQYFFVKKHEVGSCKEGEVKELRLLGKGLAADIGGSVLIEIDRIIYIPIHDLQGNIVSLLNLEGQQVSLVEYQSFGTHTLLEGEQLSPWLYASKRYDSETEFYYFGQRYYSPEIGRWISPDPLSYQAGPNRYAYLLNAPLTHVDGYGLLTIPSWMLILHPQLIVLDADKCSALNLCAQAVFTSRDPRTQQAEKNQTFLNSTFCRGDVNSFAEGAWNHPERGIGFTNGIRTDLWECREYGRYISELGSGCAVDLVHNPSNGFVKDSLRYYISSNLLYNTKVVDQLQHNWNSFFEHSSEQSRYLQIAHSEGVNNVRNGLSSYDKERRSRIDVLAVAPSVYIDPDLCGSATHLVSKNDVVPMIDQRGAQRNTDSITYLNPHPESSFLDHNFRSPTYERNIHEYIQGYMEHGKNH